MAEVVFTVDRVGKTYTAGGGMLRRKTSIQALSDVSLEVVGGETLGIVGESGSGKSTLVRLLLALEAPSSGTLRYRGGDLAGAGRQQRLRLRREVQVVLQDPVASLDPRMRVEEIVGEPLRLLRIPGDRRARIREMLAAVGLPGDAAGRYPHQFSGGQRQRIAIARALAPRPLVLVADEPVSALDLSVRAQVLNLLEDLRREFQLTLVLVAHDLSLVRHMCDRVAVMSAGRVVEYGTADAVFSSPRDPYTKQLLAAIPRLRR